MESLPELSPGCLQTIMSCKQQQSITSDEPKKSLEENDVHLIVSDVTPIINGSEFVSRVFQSKSNPMDGPNDYPVDPNQSPSNDSYKQSVVSVVALPSDSTVQPVFAVYPTGQWKVKVIRIGNTDDNIYQCYNCAAGLSSYKSLKTHYRSHLPYYRYYCHRNGCDYWTKHGFSLTKHLKSKTGCGKMSKKN